MKPGEIRSRFVNYYKEFGFQLLPRASMLDPSIPMSFVMSAGLVQVEIALAKVKNRSGKKVVLVQNCFRHFDLKSVGRNDIHPSLFEMPAAFVFEKVERKSTIKGVWKLVTEVLGVNAERIWVSYFNGDDFANRQLPKDEQTYKAWLDLGIPQNQIVGYGREHNYWVQGGSLQNQEPYLRKSGPHTELFFDRGIQLKCSPECQPGCKCGRFVEFANILFISYELNPQTNEFIECIAPFDETVIGTERVAMILQNADSVLEIQSYRFVINAIHNFIEQTNLSAKLVKESEHVIADHLRALYVLVSDGAPPPGKGGRAYIIKILVRGVITRQIMLGITSPDFLSTILDIIAKTFDDSVICKSYTADKVKMYFEMESQRFRKTIKLGQGKIERLLMENKEQKLSDSQLLSLEKKWGIPIRLTELILQKNGLTQAEW